MTVIFNLSSLRMDLHGRTLLLLLSALSAFGGNVTEDGGLDKIGKVLFTKWRNYFFDVCILR